MAKRRTVIIHDVPASEREQVATDLESEGYKVNYQQEEDGLWTVVGTKKDPR